MEDTSTAAEASASWRDRGFSFAVRLAAIALILLSPAILIALGWFLEEFEETAGAAAVSHRVHEVSFGVLFALMLVGVLAQLRNPRGNGANVNVVGSNPITRFR